MAELEAGQAPEITFEGSNPILRVKDVTASIDYYVNVLGFKVTWQTPLFACVSRGRVGLFLSQGDQGHPGSWVWIGVSDCEALCAEYRRKGARIRHEPSNYQWALEMQVEDLDGNILRMGSDQKEGAPIGEWLDMYGDRWTHGENGEWTKVEKE
jgi:catechol 2,3-dioxygenase-like lactoylglutathione lyase family enzyme